MKSFLVSLGTIAVTSAVSSRYTCVLGNHDSCEPTDGAGSCCAKVTVTNKVSGNTENVLDEFIRCYDFDAVLSAFDNNGILVDSVSIGGNGNSYTMVCSDPIATDKNAKMLAMGTFSVLATAAVCFA